jgi:hypothetical protein
MLRVAQQSGPLALYSAGTTHCSVASSCSIIASLKSELLKLTVELQLVHALRTGPHNKYLVNDHYLPSCGTQSATQGRSHRAMALPTQQSTQRTCTKAASERQYQMTLGASAALTWARQ